MAIHEFLSLVFISGTENPILALLKYNIKPYNKNHLENNLKMLFHFKISLATPDQTIT